MSVRADQSSSFDPVAPRFQRLALGQRVTLHDDDDFDLFARAKGDGRGCLSFLLSSGSAEGVTPGAISQGAGGDGPSRRALRAAGLAIAPDGRFASVAVAAAHPALARIFSESAWVGVWSHALMTLPGASRGDRLLYGRVYSPSVMLPRETVDDVVRDVLATDGAAR